MPYPVAACRNRNATAPVVAPSLLLTDLVIAWPLSEASGNRADLVGGQTLTDNNTVGSAAGNFSDVAASFVAANSESLSRASESLLQFGGKDRTISFWLYLATTGNQPIVAKEQSETREFRLDVSSGNLRFFDDDVQFIAYDSISATTWTHVMLEFNNTAGTCSLIVNNGTPQTGNGTITPTSHTFWLGHDGSNNTMDGRMQHVYIWDKILSSDEKAALAAGAIYPFTGILPV